MNDNLDTLRKIAEAATPGPWVLDGFGEGGCSDGCCGEYTRLSVYSGTNQGEVVASEVTALRNADYFDTFDPPTVLALLSRLEQAEKAVARVRAMADEMGEGKAFGILTRGREDEYPISYFIEMLEDALDGEPNE